jgi:hypothetical protein
MSVIVRETTPSLPWTFESSNLRREPMTSNSTFNPGTLANFWS